VVAPFAAGIAAGRAFEVGAATHSIEGASLIAAIAILLSRLRRAWSLALSSAMFLAGAGHFAAHHRRIDGWETRPPRETSVCIRVIRTFPRADATQAAGIALITEAPRIARDLVGLRVYYSARLRSGQPHLIRSGVVRLTGLVTPVNSAAGFDSFDRYLTDSGVMARLSRVRVNGEVRPPKPYYVFLERSAARLNEWLSAGVLAKQPALTAVYRAMMLGEKHELNDEQNDFFVRSGTMHLFAINGLHIGVVAVSLHALLGVLRCRRWLAATVVLAVLWLDVDTTGASPSAVRAFLLVACAEFAFVSRKPANGIASLSAAALCVLLLDPFALFSASFQMSYGVVLTILCLGLPLAECLQARLQPYRSLRKPTWTRRQKIVDSLFRKLWPTLAIGISAALVSAITGPQFFGVLAPLGLFANIVLVPLAALVIVAGVAAIVSALVAVGPATVLFNHAAIVILAVIDWLIRLTVKLPAAWWTAQWRAAWAAPLFLTALLVAVLWGYAHAWKLRAGGWFVPFAVVLAGIVSGVKFG
jgi:competence protein ComEC